MTGPRTQRRAAVEAFLRDPDHLAVDDGVEHGAATDRPECYELTVLRRRLVPVLARLTPEDFEQLARDRNLMILASPTAQVKPLSSPGEIDPIAYGAYSFTGHWLEDGATFRLDRPPDSWVTKLGRVEVELAPRLVFAGIVLHECVHVLINYRLVGGTVDAAAVQRIEDEAVARACELGFRRETKSMIDFFATRFPDAGAIVGHLPGGCD
jgi:hypothetical protein